jgi:KDO2-lipid IV(A) lauroyltransferase
MSSRITYLVEYIPFYIIARGFSVLPFSLSVKAGRMIGGLLYRIDRKHRNLASENISLALGLSRSEAEALAKRVFENIGMTFAEFIKIPVLDRDFIENNIAVDGLDNYLEAKAEGKGVLLLAAHLGNWELLAAPLRGEKVSVVYKKTKNPYVNSFINGIRGSYGLKTISHRNAVKDILAALKRGEGVGILLDQHAGMKEAVIVDFLGRPASTNIGLAIIALKTGAPVVPIFLVREGEGRYRAVYEEPIYLQKSGDSEKDIREATVRFNSVIEKYVRRYPEQWFWVHNRWKIAKQKGEG